MTPTDQIDKRITDLNDWRGDMISKLRKLIHEAVPGIIEDWKWDTPVFKLKTNICALGAFKDHVKLNFFKGSLLSDPEKLLPITEAKSRAIDFRESDIDKVEKYKEAIKKLVKEAANL